MTARPTLVHVTTTDMSLALLLGPQLEAFAARGWRVIGMSAPGPFVDRLRESGIEHVALRHATRAMAPLHDVRALREIHELLRALAPDVVHTHNPKPGVYGRLAARAAGVGAVVNTVHGLYATRTDRWRRRAAVYAVERVAASCSDVELVQNPEDLETLARLGVPRRRLRLLGNGVDLDRFRPGRLPPARRAALRAELGAGDDAVVCGVVARLVREKGVVEILEAARRLAGRDPAVVVAVVGPRDPDKGDGLTDAELDGGRAAGVRFLGLRHDVDDLYGAMDLFALASWREGFPRAAMEAAASGLPVVATDVRGCRQVVDDAVTGMLVPVRDPVALATAIGSLARDPARRSALGRAARDKAEREFDQRRVIDLTLRTYDELLARRAAA